ncbi:cardiolipin synthase [Gluconobacter albidus]|uniref:Cardiolipin synthase n=1 Tax=Gluconobacter albidus TaxID=318683 RepID=A0AAW3QWQ2_9PROT|nr:cardiolipin synthase [Gluconobacter albidus]KXV38161.1 phospholipase [Gluconobacter albidus]GBQ88676.1 phospholipase D [Gluconobacter albidus NBRC 3250]GLQ69062.1 cardiolipin synthetase [Gluconobacter albidus]
MLHWTVFHLLVQILRWVLPLFVTVHALVHKRNTASCTGWIGICWIAPFLGTVLYLMFGINRVRRRAQKMVDRHLWEGRDPLAQYRQIVDGTLAPLSKMLGRLTERPLMRGNSITCLHDGDNAYPVMLEAIGQAKTSIILCSYIFRDDKVGQRFVEALVAAKRRGVEVRVLVDGIGSGYFRCGIERRLRREGVACARFMHSVWPWRMPFINLRNHRKILVVDGTIGFMGGLNIGEENMLRLRTKLPVADTHFRLQGPIVHQLAVAFAWDWSFTTGEELQGERYLPEPQPVGDVPMRIVTSGPDTDLEKIEYGMLQAFSLARTHIWVMTPYFLTDDRFSTELVLAALRGVVIDIVVPKSSNHALIDHARDANLRQFLDAGCRVWMADPPFNHSKLMVVDDEWSFVGSANIDMRSLRLNFEINLEIYDRDVAKELATFMETHRRNRLTHHDLDSKPFLIRMRNNAVRLLLPYL